MRNGTYTQQCFGPPQEEQLDIVQAPHGGCSYDNLEPSVLEQWHTSMNGHTGHAHLMANLLAG